MSVNLDIHTERWLDEKQDLEIVLSGTLHNDFGTIEFEVKRGGKSLSQVTVFVDQKEVNEALVKLTSFQPEVEDYRDEGESNA